MPTYAFGPFRLDADAEILFRGSDPLPVGKRAVALLRVLVERAGAPVSKDTLIDAAWAGLAVEESNLTVQIAALRRTLGEVPGGVNWIVTMPRRGYRFVGPVVTKSEAQVLAIATVDAAAKLTPTTALALSDKPSLRCSKCGHDNGIGAKFCEECATQLVHTCTSCGTQFSPMAKFCPECSHPTKSPQSRFFSPDAYTPTHLAQKIHTSKTAVEGERKQITVLFATLEGAMELLADRDPEEACKILDPVLERMMEAVHHYEGTVNKVMDDGFMALFGAPIAHEDHAARACYAALRMQEIVRQRSHELRCAQGIELEIRVGLNSGDVVVRAIGTDLRMDYTAVGRTTHLAARMEQLAVPGSIRLTTETWRLSEGLIEVISLGPMPIRGLVKPVEVFELVGLGTARARFEAAASRGLTRFVGRDSEMSQLRDALDQARHGHGQVVALVGEPGAGKSRLAWEVIHSRTVHDWLVLRTGAVSYGKTTAYLAVIELLKGYFKIHNRADLDEIRNKVTGKLLALDNSLTPALSPLLALLDVPVDDVPWKVLDPGQRRRRTLDAVRQLLLREGRDQPLLLIFEDLHWIDGETQAFLDSLVESLPASRILLLVNYRPEYSHTWSNKSYYSQLQIDSLSPEIADALLDQLLGAEAAHGPLKRLLVEGTEANPFFLEESVRALAETGALAGERGAYRLTRAVDQLKVPASVRALLASRIDRLAPECKRLLQAAAVVGKVLPLALLLPIADVPEEEARTALTRLQAAEFLYQVNQFPDVAYTFKHALTHEVAYASVLQERRRALHCRILTAIETVSRDRLAEQVERLGYHAFQGQLWGKAVTYLRQAGVKAQRRSANREAMAQFQQAIEALRHLPPERMTIEQAIDIRTVEIRNSLVPLGQYRALLPYLREAQRMATEVGDRPRECRVLLSLNEYFRLVGDPDVAIEAGQRALALATDLNDLPLQTQASVVLGATFQRQGNYLDARETLMRNVRLLTGELNYEQFGHMNPPSVSSRTWLVWSLAELGEFAEGEHRASEELQIAKRVGFYFGLVHAYFATGVLHLWKGQLGEAITALENGLGSCRAGNIAIFFPLTAGSLGYAYALAGRCTEGIAMLEQSAERLTEMHIVMNHSMILCWLSEACLLAGHVDKANASGELALNLAHENKEKGHYAWALRLQGELAAHGVSPDITLASAQYNHAISLASQLGMRPLVARCHFGLGNLYHRADNREQARQQLETAAAMFQHMGMTYWLGQVEAKLRQLG
jgi:class 3 adenylate cyclase/DNA-binding winged helix-turn-helix (wHTH) protein/tetratricopeptide (TPR) repeat protein